MIGVVARHSKAIRLSSNAFRNRHKVSGLCRAQNSLSRAHKSTAMRSFSATANVGEKGGWLGQGAALTLLAIGVGGAGVVLLDVEDNPALSEGPQLQTRDPAGLPYYSKKEVSLHKRKEDRIWVTYKDGVYDITDFVDAHPGGSRILLASGGPIDHFWAMYNQHTTKQVLDILARHRIGTLYPHEMTEVIDFADPYSNDPKRAPLGVVRCEKPFNSETVVELIPDNFVTPEPMHYKRHHHPVPDVKAEDYKMVLAFEDANILQITYDDIKKRFPKKEFAMTLQCAGNRRHELEKVSPVQGLEWDCGAISTSVWGGALLRDVLAFAGMGDESTLMERAGVEHILFEGTDQPYDASIPIDKALSKFGDVLVAYEMNGKPIPREHGGPIRIIVPGHLAARSVKWCQRITASKKEANSGWQRGWAYKATPSHLKSFEGHDSEEMPSVQELPVNSAICLPRPNAEIDYDDGEITLKGWAWSGGGRNIVRVDVSIDGGKTWHPAELKEGADQKLNHAWAWTLWEADVKIPEELAKAGQKLELVCRAVDRAMNTQPEDLASVWNIRGIMNNAFHRIPVTLVEPKDD